MIRPTLLLSILIGCVSCTKKESERFSLVDGQKQHILEMGTGEPAVIFLTGRGSRLETFTIVQKEIAGVTRTLSYDRAGLGKSEPLDTVRSFGNMVRELDQILENERILPPYMLVGHSLGGFLARYYFQLHPERVGGMVLIDPGHEDDAAVLLSSRSGQERKTLDSLIHAIRPEWPDGVKQEYKYSDYNNVLTKGINPPSGIPVTLIISIQWDEKEVGITRKDVYTRTRLMTDWLKEIKGGKAVFTEKSGHFIHKEEPELVTNEIKEMIDVVRASRKRVY